MDGNEYPNFISPYGEREGARTQYSKNIEYVAQGYDEDLRAYRMDHRDYDPVLKRFMTPDSLFFEDPSKCVENGRECNLFSYAGGNPISHVDPSGKSSLRIGFTGGGAAGIGGYVTPMGVAVSYSQEHGLMAALFSNAGHTANAGQPGGSYGLAVTFSPSENKLENGGSTSIIHGAEIKTPVGGVGLDHSSEIATGENSYTVTVGQGMSGEYHTGIEHEVTYGATHLFGGNDSGKASHVNTGGPVSSHMPEVKWNQNSSSKGEF
jgi:RHS repeat-associated protein